MCTLNELPSLGEGMFKVGKWPSPAAAQSIGRSQEAWIARLYQVDFIDGALSDWASGLSLAAEQSIEVGSRNMNMGVLQVALF